MSSATVRIATRKSPLALWQAEHIKSRLEQLHPGIVVELLGLQTKGDKILDTPLAKVGGKGLFVKELEAALLDQRADFAVHSMKDVPAEFPPGLELAVICEREDPRDAFVSNHYAGVDDLPQGAVVGTCSLRRQAQLRERRPDLKVVDLRGNVNTRLAKLDAGEFDAILLAASGLKRLAMEDRIRAILTPEESLPAVGQGALGIECRQGDQRIHSLLSALSHQESSWRVTAERAMNARLEGGCQVPIGAYAELQGSGEQQELWLRGLVAQPDGTKVIRGEISGPVAAAQQLGEQLGDQLLADGAGDILQQLYQSSSS